MLRIEGHISRFHNTFALKSTPDTSVDSIETSGDGMWGTLAHMTSFRLNIVYYLNKNVSRSN